MFTKSKSRQTILLDKELDLHVKKDSSVDIILSPTLYWVKKFKVPVGSNKEALKLLPSLFEEYLPSGEYSYFGYFEGDDFIGFAYDKKIILALLKEKGVELSQISSLHFAQSEFKGSYLPYALDANRVLLMQEGIVLIMPKIFAKEAKKINLQEIILSSHVEKLDYKRNVNISQKTLFLFSILMSILIGIDLIAWFMTSQKSMQIQMKRKKLFIEAKLPPTMIQNRSLLKKYEKIYQQQYILRDILHKLFLIDFTENEVISKIVYHNKKLILIFLNIKNKDQLLRKLKGLNIKYISSKSGQFIVEIAI